MKTALVALYGGQLNRLDAGKAALNQSPSDPIDFRQGPADESQSELATVTESLLRDQLHQVGESQARLSVTIPRTLYRQIRLLALDQDTTLSALVARLIRKELG